MIMSDVGHMKFIKAVKMNRIDPFYFTLPGVEHYSLQNILENPYYFVSQKREDAC